MLVLPYLGQIFGVEYARGREENVETFPQWLHYNIEVICCQNQVLGSERFHFTTQVQHTSLTCGAKITNSVVRKRSASYFLGLRRNLFILPK
jgi:hypothetical protein